MAEPKLLCEPGMDFPLKALADMSNFELLIVLERGGWEWKPLPTKRKRAAGAMVVVSVEPKDDGSFSVGPKIFYGGFQRMYARALAMAEQRPCALSAAKIVSIKHCGEDKYYAWVCGEETEEPSVRDMGQLDNRDIEEDDEQEAAGDRVVLEDELCQIIDDDLSDIEDQEEQTEAATDGSEAPDEETKSAAAADGPEAPDREPTVSP